MNALSNLGIDGWNLLLYLINVGLLIFVLGRFLYRPLIKYLDERRETVRKNIEEAEVLKKNFQAELNRQEQKTQELINKLETDVAQARIASEERAKKIITRAENDSEKILGEAVTQAEVIKRQINKEVEQELIMRVQAVVRAVLRSKIPAKFVEESVNDAWNELKKDLQQ